MSTETFFVAVLANVKPLGYVIIPYICLREKEKFISIHERLSALNIGNYPDLTTAEKEIFSLSETYTNQAILKQFSKKKETPKDFFAHLDSKILTELVRPFIERKLDKIIRILFDNNILFCNGKGGSNLYAEDTIHIERDMARTSLKFIRTSEGTQYKLRAFNGESEIALNSQGNIILVNEPCWYLAGNTLLNFNEQINGKLLLPFQSKEFVSIPKHIEFQYFSTFIRKLANRCEIEAEGFKMNDLQSEPAAILSLETDWQGKKSLILHFRYGDKMILANNRQHTFTSLVADENGFVFNRIKRNISWETAQINVLKSMNLKQYEAVFSLSGSVTDSGSHMLVEWLTSNHTLLQGKGFSVVQPENKRYIFEVPVLDLETSEGADWFDLQGTVFIHEHKIPFIRFRNHIIENIKEYQLPGGEIVLLPDEWFSRFQDIMIYAREQNQSVRLGRHHINLLKSLPGAAIENALREIEFPEKVALPPLKNVTLRPYQRIGFYWMHALCKNGLGGILADDMGLGKTLQTIALLASMYPEGSQTEELEQALMLPATPNSGIQLDLFDVLATQQTSKPATNSKKEKTECSLIVLPSSLIHNWLNELKRFAPWLQVYVHTGSNRAVSEKVFGRYHIVLTTYGTLRNDIQVFEKYVFHLVILDESQTIKNPDSKTTQAVFTLNSAKRMVLTGTPIQNTLSDIWSQFNFLNPGMLGTHRHFLKYYEAPLAKNQDEVVAGRLKNLIKPFILRRTKEEVTPELPPVTETAVLCAMSEEQQRLYEIEKSKARNILIEKFRSSGTQNSSVIVLRALMMLRQLANHPRLLDSGSEAGSGKFTEVTESLETVLAENHKVLVFSSFVRHLKLLEEYCISRSHRYAMLTGSTTNREKVIRSFKQETDTRLFLISLKAGGVGLNLTEAGYVFILDPWWNPAAEMQALNRAHRIGQDKSVFVYRFITKDTVEEKIVRLQQKKQELADIFVNSDTQIAGMSQEEIMLMFD